MISDHLCRVLWVRNKSQVPPTLKGKELNKGMSTFGHGRGSWDSPLSLPAMDG